MQNWVMFASWPWGKFVLIYRLPDKKESEGQGKEGREGYLLKQRLLPNHVVPKGVTAKQILKDKQQTLPITYRQV